jgi:hypothetical protein
MSIQALRPSCGNRIALIANVQTKWMEAQTGATFGTQDSAKTPSSSTKAFKRKQEPLYLERHVYRTKVALGANSTGACDLAEVVGTWEGKSTRQVANSACPKST